MRATQQIFRTRRQYNKWVGNETLEDYALRFTAIQGRRWSIDRVAQTALGATAFLALEAISAAVFLSYGFVNATIAMFTVAAVIFITGAPISYYAAKHGLDIDLLTRGAGFGYLGSTVTSLIYASFTFIFFAIEAAILASALQALLGIPLAAGYIISAVAVIPIVTHGIRAISKFQIGTQPLWLLLQCAALIIVAVYEFHQVSDWTRYAPDHLDNGGAFDWVLFGAAASIFFAMVAQIGEQVDYLRFMPPKTRHNRARWWFWLTLAGPGWILPGLVKMLLGSFLAYLAFIQGAGLERASDPTYMYQMAFNYVTQSPTLALVLAGVMVIISQMKINVTNAYAGSIAWSNFFSRLTHNHPGRVVWLVFNVTIALVLMELGIYRALEAILGVFAVVAISWLGSVSADLMINKPLGLSPAIVEFKRAHLYDINPVGVGAMGVASVAGILCYLGLFGEVAKNLAHFISLGITFVLVPIIAWLTQGRYYLARQASESPLPVESGDAVTGAPQTLTCCICETPFEHQDMAHCPAYQGAICSLCCTLDGRCLDSCKPEARVSRQIEGLLELFLPHRIVRGLNSRVGRFAGILLSVSLVTAALLALIYYQMTPLNEGEAQLLLATMWTLFFTLLIVFGVMAWLFLLAHESRGSAQSESNRQTRRLIEEIEAHDATDRELQKAKELAERANNAKTRYLTGISHELRTPLHTILGYAQLLGQQQDIAGRHREQLRIIHRNGEYLADLLEGLLDISKIEAARLDIYRNQVKLPELLEQLVNMFHLQARAKDIGFHYHVDDTLPDYVVTDDKRLRQILINLLSNAIKYTETGRVDFSVSYRYQVARFSVRDTGVGIQPADLERILDPFERVRNAHVPNVSGTGLGLTIVRLLTEVMGGELNIDSRPGEGSCFSVSLMLSRLEHPEPGRGDPRPIMGYTGRRRTVLVVDDDALHRGLIFDMLSPLGFTTLEARDAPSCLASVAEGVPDLFLIDVSMPGTDGLTLARQLRTLGHTAPIVMISADAQEHHRRPDDSQAHDDYMVKPISTQLLLDKVGALLHLQWRYRDETTVPGAGLSIPPPAPPAADALTIPNHGLVRQLQAYSRLGYRRGVVDTLDEIESDGILTAHTLAVLKTLSDTLQFAQLADTLERETL